jgi:hypothetical protein
MDQQNQQMPASDKKVCNCPHHKVGPWLIILIGVILLLGVLDILTYRGILAIVGILAIAIGITKLNGHKCGCCSK